MNALEDRLHEYLNSLEPAVPAPSLRRVDKVDARFVQAGLSPYLNLKGAIMQPQEPPENPVPMRVRICSHVTQAKFLHIEDSLGMGKLRLFAGTYRKGNGMTVNGHAQHFLDVEDARVVFHALAVAEPNFAYKEYKGTAQPDGKVVSRVLSVISKGDQVYIELKTGPGTKTPTGAVTPNGKAEVEVNVAFKTYEARRLGQTVLAYIQAWDILRLMAHRNLLGKMAAYELVPTTSRNGTNSQQVPRQTPPIPTTPAGPSGQSTRSSNKAVNGQQNPVRSRPASAAAPTPTTQPVQTNKPETRLPAKEQGLATTAAAKRPHLSTHDQLAQTTKPPADAAALTVVQTAVQSATGTPQPVSEPAISTPAAATASISIEDEPIVGEEATTTGTPERPAANGHPPTRPLTRRGPVRRADQATTSGRHAPTVSPVVNRQVPVAAAASATSFPSVSQSGNGMSVSVKQYR